MKFNIANEDADCKACKETFIKEYAKNRLEVCSKLFPNLPQAELNLLVMAGFEAKNIKQLIKQKDSNKDMFLILCGALDEMETPADES